MIYRTLSKALQDGLAPWALKLLALQDGLAPWALKLLEIFRNCKKLNIN